MTARVGLGKIALVFHNQDRCNLNFMRPTISDLRKALKPLAGIPRPFGDNEGDAINSDSVFPDLTRSDQEKVRHAETVAQEYSRSSQGSVSHRSVNAMTRNGFETELHPSRQDSDRLVDSVKCGDWELDISDPTPTEDE